MKKQILMMFGGVSAEHEVSIVTGLQALEHVDTAHYEPIVVYISKKGVVSALPTLQNRKEFLTAKRTSATFGRDKKGGYISFGFPTKKIYPYAAYLAFHGGTGEGGAYQGLLEACGIPFTSPTQEASVTAMNKQLTKEVLRANGIPTAPSARLFASAVEKNTTDTVQNILKELPFPIIIKPVHLGSSIGISITRTEIELEKKLIEASAVDGELLLEPFFSPISEYNCAVRRVNGKIETSPIEHPLSHDEILSFADKYERAGKKTGAGMASLSRELPAKISGEFEAKIKDLAVRAFECTRMKGMVRIDFMVVPGDILYLTEINTIPGSMAYYLWESAGISYTQFNTELIEQSVVDAAHTQRKQLEYHSDIIERFVQE